MRPLGSWKKKIKEGHLFCYGVPLTRPTNSQIGIILSDDGQRQGSNPPLVQLRRNPYPSFEIRQAKPTLLEELIRLALECSVCGSQI